jgi:acetyl-CoA carboxylase carboxyltransferase component
VDTEGEALELVRALLRQWPSHAGGALPVVAATPPNAEAVETLPTIVPAASNAVFDMEKVLRGVLDEDTWIPVSAAFARSVLTGFGRLDGVPVGIVASQPRYKGGVLDTVASRKVARLVDFCGRFGLPVVTFVDVPGFLPGIEEERRGVITFGAQILKAYVEAEVPKLTVVVRKAYGGAYIAMGSRSLGADMSWAWAGAELAVMGPAGAVGILHRKALAEAEDPQALRAELAATYRDEVTRPYLAAERGILGEVILPGETRARLIDALGVFSSSGTRPTPINIARRQS